jgi:predicted metal-binding protein
VGVDANLEGDMLQPVGGTDSRVTVIVCESCRNETGSTDSPGAGQQLATDTRRAAEGSDISVVTVACLGNCKRRLSAAMVKAGAWSYVFGDLSEDSGADLVTGAKLFAASTDGLIPWRGRPEILKRGLIARIPPPNQLKET